MTSKGDLRTCNSKMGELSFFSMDLVDESGEIRATCWREAADRFFPIVEVGKLYMISRAQLKMANKKFSSLNNQYEMSLGYDSQVQLCVDQSAPLPKVRYAFVPIADIAARPVNATVDVLGVVQSVSPVSRIVAKQSGRELVKRTVSIADESAASIEVTVWGNQAEAFPEVSGTAVVAFKGLRVTEWNQRSLGMNMSSTYEVEPDHERVAALKEWWQGCLLYTS